VLLARGDTGVALLGVGESSDAHHMSAPHPQGLGAQLAMRAALDDAGLAPDAIDYINLHGTATPANDAAESLAVSAVFGRPVACSSTKGATGHTMGAAGAVEAAITVGALHGGWIPPTANFLGPDPECPLDVCAGAARAATLEVAMSNSFAFGGLNASLVFGRSA
jgi:3-oxoacyl-[acyl-carrier-protein] synthase-1